MYTAFGYYPTLSGFSDLHVVVAVRGREMVIRCPTYFEAVKWARMECKSYKIPEPDRPDDEETDDLPLFLRSDFLRSD